MTNQNSDLLEETLSDLSESKKEFISEDALEAKLKFDDVKDDLENHELSFDDPEEYNSSLIDIDSFNDNVKLLLSIFKQSRFDEFIVLLGNPQRLYVTQLLMGFFKGAGLVLGAVFILAVMAYVFGENTLLSLLL